MTACINPLTAVHRVRNGELLSKSHKDQITKVINEVSSVLEDLGYLTLSINLWQQAKLSKFMRSLLIPLKTVSSMLNDVLEDR